MSENNYTAKFGIDASELKKELSLINANLKNLKAQVKLNAISNADYEKSINTLNDVIDENVKKEKALSDELERLRKNSPQDLKAITDKSTALKNQQTATFQARKALEDFKESNNKARKETDIHTVKIDMLSHAIYDLAKALTEKACKALVDFTKETINTGMQFESAFAGVRKVTSGTEEDFKKLETQIRQTALVKPIDADQLASIYQMGSQLGIAKDGLKDFSDAIIDLAKTSDLTEEAGATMIAQYANVTHLPVEEYRKFASTLSYLGSNTATTESTIMNFASRIAGSAKLIGMTDAEILALSTAMGSVGIQAEMGGSAISKIMNSIATAVDKNSEDLQIWAKVAGKSASEFADIWTFDVAEAFRLVIAGMSDFKDEGGSLNLLLEQLDIKNIRQTETLKKLANASELLTNDIKLANKEWQQASFLGTATEAVYSTLESKTQMLDNSVKELQITLFKKVLSKPLTDLATTATKVTKGIIDNIDTIIVVAKGLISVLAGIITKFLVLQAIKFKNAIVSGFTAIKNAVVSLATSLKTAIVAQEGLNLAMASNVIGVVVTGIMLLVGALQSFCSNSDSAMEATKKHTEELKKQRDQLVENENEIKKTNTEIDNQANATLALVDKLDSLVDSNGKVIGSKEELLALLPQIKNATGIQIDLLNNEIKGYDKLKENIKNVIEQKRIESKLRAHQNSYDEANGNIDNVKKEVEANNKKVDELRKELEEESKKAYTSTHQGLKVTTYTNRWHEIKKEIETLNSDNKLLEESREKYQKAIDEYENLIVDHAKANQSELDNLSLSELQEKEKTAKEVVDAYRKAMNEENGKVSAGMVENAEKALSEIRSKIKKMKEFANGELIVGTGGTDSGSSSGTKSSTSKKEETHTSYQELLNQEKAYETQLQNYLTAIKQGNSEITIEMVQDTKKKLDEVQKKVNDMKQLLGENTITTKLVLDDETYGGLNKKREELAKQLKDMQNELTKGNQNITQDMLNNVGKQIDQIDAKIKNLKNEWDESGNDGEISDEFESENTNHISSGVIFGKGVLGDNAVEIMGAGKDAAAAYLDAYEAEKERRNNELVVQAKNQAQQEALSYQEATIDPNNLAVYDLTEKQLAESKQTSQAQGLTDNAYKVIDAETWTLNQAINAAMQIDFTQIGRYMCEGIANGIRENAHVVIGAVRAMMEEANAAAETAEKIDSPSKVFYGYGRFMDLGMANGIRDYAKLVSNQVRDMTKRANDAISLANNQISAERFGNANALRGTGNTEINYNFTQNNTSNKSLDTLAIYQESKSMLKRAIRNQYV